MVTNDRKGALCVVDTSWVALALTGNDNDDECKFNNDDRDSILWTLSLADYGDDDKVEEKDDAEVEDFRSKWID